MYECLHISCLVHLEATVDVANKCQGGPEWHTAQHQCENHGCEQRVAKELCALHQATHRGPVSIVEHRVDEDEEASGASAQHTPPPPAVVLAWQEEVGERNRDAGTHWEEDSKDAQQDAVKSVVLSAPDGGKDVVELHWNGTEEKKKQQPRMSLGKQHLQGYSQNLFVFIFSFTFFKKIYTNNKH